MGRIKGLLIKRTTKKLLKLQNKFTENFEHDKKVLGNMFPSKSMRNKIAGYIARLKRVEKEKKRDVE